MPAIVIIDDRKDVRETMKHLVESDLPKGWECIDIDPLMGLEEYPSWIKEYDIAVMLLDERLHEQAEPGNHVDYEGHDLVEFLRKHLPLFPIFIITAFADTPELQEKFKDVEEIIKRIDFSQKSSEYVTRFVRSAQRYLETYQSELTELSEKSKKIAEGKATKKDIEKIEAIQSKINMAFPYESFESRNEWIAEFDKKLKDLVKLKAQIEKFLKK